MKLRLTRALHLVNALREGLIGSSAYNTLLGLYDQAFVVRNRQMYLSVWNTQHKEFSLADYVYLLVPRLSPPVLNPVRQLQS